MSDRIQSGRPLHFAEAAYPIEAGCKFKIHRPPFDDSGICEQDPVGEIN